MRLIDADALVTVQSYDPMNEESSQDEMTVADALDFATEEGCPSIIDAIPVEWLRGLMNILVSGDALEQGQALFLSNVIEAWQKEQEA